MVDHFCATYGFLKHFDTKIILIGWQAYRGDQIHRKNSPTEPRNQIQVKYEKHLPAYSTFKTRLTADFGKIWILEKVPGLLETSNFV